jgi:hypothetical protein
MATTTTTTEMQGTIRSWRGWPKRPRPKVAVSLSYLQEHLERGIITQRDQQLMQLLADCPVLSYDQIKRLYWPTTSQVACRRRLRKLYDMHYLDRAVDVSAKMGEIGLEPGLVYTLGRAGRMWLEKLQSHAKTSDYPLMNIPLILHDLGLAEVMVLLTLALRQRGVTMIWQGEAAARMIEGEEKTARVLLEPDAMLTIEYRNGGSETKTIAFFVEWDTGSERGNEFVRKIQRYDLVRNRDKTWAEKGFSNFPGVMLITPTPTRAANLAGKILKHRQTKITWLTSDIISLGQDTLGKIWRVIPKDKDQIFNDMGLLPATVLSS